MMIKTPFGVSRSIRQRRSFLAAASIAAFNRYAGAVQVTGCGKIGERPFHRLQLAQFHPDKG
jgi:hypothetical protein